MKKLLLILGISLFLYQTQAQNLVLNGGMETWTSETVPTSWEKAESVTKESTVIKEGSFSAKQTAGTTDIQQDFTIEAGATYTISYWFLDNDANAKSRIWSYWLNGTSTLASDNTAELRPSVYSSDNSAWQQYSQTIVAPAGATGFRFEVRTYNDGAGGGSIYYDGFSVVKQGGSTSTSTDILSFSVPGQQGTSLIDNTAGTISFTMAPGADVTALVPTITLASGATISPVSGVAQNFTAPVTYVVTAQDGTTKKNFTASVNFASTTTLLYEDFETLTNNGEVSLTGWNNINEVGTRKWIGKLFSNNLYAQFSSYSSTAPEANTAWLITPEVDLDNSIDEVFSFKVNVGYYNHDGLTVLLSQNYDGTNLASATWDDITSSFTIPQTPATGYGVLTKAGEKSLANYTGKVRIAFKYVGDGTASKTTTYQIDSVIVKGSPKASTETDILSFSVNSQVGESVIDKTNHTVKAEVLSGTGLTALVPQLTLSSGATSSPATGSVQDFTNTVVYLVTAQDGVSQQEWAVTVTETITLSDLADVTAFSFVNEVRPSQINLADTTITALLPWDAALTALTPTISVSAGAQVSPTVAQDFTNPVIYTVTAQNGVDKKYWKVTVSKASEPSHLAEITGFALSQLAAEVTIDSQNGTITGELAAGTVVTSLVPTITISEGATITPIGAQDFTNAVSYTVTAEDGITQKVWTVTLTVKTAALTTIYEIQYSEDPTGVTPMLNQVIKTQGIVTGKDAKGIFIQDGEGAWKGINVYKGSEISANIGDLVTVEGKVIEYQNLTEIGTPTVTVVSSGNALPNAVTVSLADFKTEQFEGVLVKIANVVCIEVPNANGNWKVKNQSNDIDTLIVRNQLFTFTPELGQTFTSITGIGTQYKADYQFLPRSTEDYISSVFSENEVTPSVYPNPVKNTITISNIEQVQSISINNILGQLVLQAESNQMSKDIDLSGLNKGVYLVTFRLKNGKVQSQKIIKE